MWFDVCVCVWTYWCVWNFHMDVIEIWYCVWKFILILMWLETHSQQCFLLSRKNRLGHPENYVLSLSNKYFCRLSQKKNYLILKKEALIHRDLCTERTREWRDVNNVSPAVCSFHGAAHLSAAHGHAENVRVDHLEPGRAVTIHERSVALGNASIVNEHRNVSVFKLPRHELVKRLYLGFFRDVANLQNGVPPTLNTFTTFWTVSEIEWHDFKMLWRYQHLLYFWTWVQNK